MKRRGYEKERDKGESGLRRRNEGRKVRVKQRYGLRREGEGRKRGQHTASLRLKERERLD